MKTKSVPKRLSKTKRNSLSFLFVKSQLYGKPKAPRKRPKNQTDFRVELSRQYDYSLVIHLADVIPPHFAAIQTVNVPLSSTFIQYLQSSSRLDIYFSSKPSMHFCLEIPGSPSRLYIEVNLPDLASILYGLSSNCLVLYGHVADEVLVVDVTVKPSAIWTRSDFNPNCVSELQYDKIISFLRFHMWPMGKFSDSVELPLFSHHTENRKEFKNSLNSIYRIIRASHSENSSMWNDSSIQQPATIKADLLQYQIEAVRWMVFRELDSVPIVNPNWFSSFYLKIQDDLYFSALTGQFSKGLPTAPEEPCLGGILADEMGLGKTLEVLSLILHRPYQTDITREPLNNLGAGPCSKKLFAFTTVFHESYEDELMDCSSDSESTKTASTSPHGTFCVCGGSNDDSAADNDEMLTLVHCEVCDSGYYQHEECVQFRRRIHTSGGEPVELVYICPLCWNHLRIHSKATLIVSPDHIWSQWQDEILMHVDISKLKVLIYEGMETPPLRLSASAPPQTFDDPSEGAPYRPNFVQPAELATADIVLTSYSVLQRELGWAAVSAEQRVGEGHRPKLRTAQRYLAPPSPLACVIWWRLCIDEAQMAENVTSKIAKMLSEVDAIHRWCVTGTPAEKKLSDFHGLLAYLRVEPFTSLHYWNALLYQPFLAALCSPDPSHLSSTMLVRLLSNLLFRNTKEQVESQLRLPVVREQIHWIEFTPVERFIHTRTLEECADALSHALTNAPDLDLNAPLVDLPADLRRQILASVTRARQACTHASLVVNARALVSKNGKAPVIRNAADPTLHISKSFRLQGTGCANMTEVIRKVIGDVRVECEQVLRLWVANRISAAVCFILQERYEHSADCYREILKKSDELESNYGVLADGCQRMHAITNLHWLIHSQGVPLENMPLPTADKNESEETEEANVDGSLTRQKLDPRVDRDLLQKASLLRAEYLKSRSHLLVKDYSRWEPVATQAEDLLTAPSTFPEDIPLKDRSKPWLTWLRRSFELLASSRIFDQLPSLLQASLQGRGSFRFNCSQAILQAYSGQQFQYVVHREIEAALDARKKMVKAVGPLHRVWYQFSKAGTIDATVLQQYSVCCSRRNTVDANHLRTRKNAKVRCAYCLALNALVDYRKVLNQEEAKVSRRAQKLVDLDDEEYVEEFSFADQSAVVESNPLSFALHLVATQVRRLETAEPWVKAMAKALTDLLRSLFNEIAHLGAIVAHTQEWWDAYDDTEQFVTRLQTTSPDEMAFIEPDEVPGTLQRNCSEAMLNMVTLETRLGQLSFLLNAHKEHQTANSDLTCPICGENLGPSRPTFIMLAGCWHSLCDVCLEKIRKLPSVSERKCPLCRRPIDTASTHAARRRQHMLIHFDGGNNRSQSEDQSDTIPVRGDHSSKIQEVLRCLKRLKLQDPTAKAVVFSSWTSILNTLERALVENKISCTTFLKPRDGGLVDFRSPTSKFWVLLIPLSLGANGLNLIEANHVLLVDPVLNPGREIQAIARVHRIGQTRPCTVHKFIVRNSIETLIHSQSVTSDAADFVKPVTSDNRSEVLQMSVAELLQIVRTDFTAMS